MDRLCGNLFAFETIGGRKWVSRGHQLRPCGVSFHSHRILWESLVSQYSEESIIRNLYGHAVRAARLRFGPEDRTAHGHTRGRYLSGGSGREPDHNEELGSLVDWLRQRHVQATSAEITEVCIGLERFPIRIHATHRGGERSAHTRLSPPLYPSVKAHQDVTALRILDVYFALNGLSPALF